MNMPQACSLHAWQPGNLLHAWQLKGLTDMIELRLLEQLAAFAECGTLSADSECSTDYYLVCLKSEKRKHEKLFQQIRGDTIS